MSTEAPTGRRIVTMLKRFDYPKYSSFIALVVLFIISAALSPYFTRPGNLVNILNQVSYTGMIALGAHCRRAH